MRGFTANANADEVKVLTDNVLPTINISYVEKTAHSLFNVV